MSSASEFEPVARQDYGPTTSSESVFENVLEHKLADNMSVPHIRTPVLKAVPIYTSTVAELEPDSTNPENTTTTYEKEVEFHIAEKPCDRELSVDALAGIVRLDEPTVDNVGRISYPIIQDGDDSNDASYIDNANATIIQAPISTAIVQNVSKLPQNFTINMDSSVGSITTFQNVAQEIPGTGQTLWLPTILATSGPTDAKIEEGSHAGISQIIITSESYVSNETSFPGSRRANIITDTSYVSQPKSSKVQILSNIAISKNSTYTSQFSGGKDAIAPVYGTQNHLYKFSTNLVPQNKYTNSVLSTKPPKSQSLIGAPLQNSAPLKNISYGPTFSKGTNLNKTLNKVNNGANLNSVATSAANTQCHVLSRVVSGPNKISGRKSANSLKGSKSGSNSLSGNAKQSRSIKIIQQTGSAHKTDPKNWPTANMTSYKSQQPAYGVFDSNNSKVIQKVGSPIQKNQQPMCLQNVSKGERLILQSPCGPVLISTAPMSTSLHKGPQYVQSGLTPNLRYVHAYSQDSTPNITQMSANQQLTAQILQSLSQPKLMLQTNHNIISQSLPTVVSQEEMMDISTINERRLVFGDPSTLLTTDDIVGVEERPNLSEQLGRYSYQTLAFVMLDHTYALPVQKQPTATATSTSPLASEITSPTQVSSPLSPLKRMSPVISSISSYETQTLPVTTTIFGPITPVHTITMGALAYTPQTMPQEDDAGSVISSVEGDKRREDRAGGGSDTETAPEGEEEGKTRCICEFTHDDGYMICCDRCGEWQHVDCMGIDRQNIPDSYMCEKCLPRLIDRKLARGIQMRKREELNALGASDTEIFEGHRLPGQRRKRLLTVTTYTDTSGSCVTTYNSNNAPALPALPTPTPPVIKRAIKRPKKTEVVKKVKRKLSEKRVKRKKEILINRTKYNSVSTNHSNPQESYETAVTNHYSQELRAKILKYSAKLGNTPNMASAITAHLCTTVPHAGGKILIAIKDLKENTPVIELRGKYMLSNQHKPQLQSTGRLCSQKPGPFVFFYRLPKDNIQICIDTRTYGNEARFVRRSCKPNAELQHCILKGTLHVFLVSISTIPSDTEITVGHDSNSSKQPCACGNPKHCKMNGLSGGSARRSVDNAPREKRSRNRCSSSSSPASPPPTPFMSSLFATPVKDPPLLTIQSEMKTPSKMEFLPMSPTKVIMSTLNFNEPMKTELECKEEMEPMDLMAKEELKSETDEPDGPPFEETKPLKTPLLLPSQDVTDIKAKEEPDTNEDNVRIVAKDEKLESKDTADSVKQEIKDEKDMIYEKEDLKDANEDKKCDDLRRITRDAKAKSACHDRSSRTSRTTCTNQDSLDDKTDDSQDKFPTNSKGKEKDKRKMTREERKMEAIMKAFERMEKQQQRKQEVKDKQKRRESDPHPNATDKDDDDDHHSTNKRRRKRKGRARTTSQTNRCRLNSADSDMVTSGDEGPSHQSPRRAPPRRDSLPAQSTSLHESPRTERMRQDLGLSSACLLVEAAVGSVECAFKLPKTKKTMANEWVGRSPERTPSPYRSPYRPSLVPATSLESLVKVASTMIGDLSGVHSETDELQSPPRTPGRDRSKPPKKSKRITRNTPPTEVVEFTPSFLPQHSAKKRWLRQAISEESDSPSAESPPNEMVTPLKKRRLARESLSCDQNHVVGNDETSTHFTSDQDSPNKDESKRVEVRACKVRNIMESLYGRDRSRSDSGQGSDDQSHLENDILNVNLKITPDSENIRRIIGVPGTEDGPPAITKIEDIKTLNNNISDNKIYSESDYNKVVPMEIDTTILPQPQIKETIDITNCDSKSGSPQEKITSSQTHSADTSGNSSPQRDEMDDIQKKIHSFHTENILMLKSRNKKPPKEKRKKVNLNFDLNMVDDQISIQLRTEDDTINGGAGSMEIPLETIPLPDPQSIPLPAIPPPGLDSQTSEAKCTAVNGDVHDEVSNSAQILMDNIPLPPVGTIPLPDPQSIPLPARPHAEDAPPPGAASLAAVDKPVAAADGSLSFTSRFSSSGLFSGIFSNINPTFNVDNQINDNIPNMQLIKSAIDRTATLDSNIFEKETISPADELKNVQEILSRVNNMDSNSSVLLSGVLNVSEPVNTTSFSLNLSPPKGSTSYCPRINDPRLNPPPVEKPKPLRRKLSISEYRKRVKGGASGGEGEAGGAGRKVGGEALQSAECSSESSGTGSVSPLRLDAALAAAATDDLEQRLHKALATANCPKGVFDAQPTASERQRENLNSRLRREFGLSPHDDEESRPPTDAPDVERSSEADSKRCDR